MAEVEFGFPGPVQYSYVHVRGTEEELKSINYEMLGAAFTYALASSRVGMNDAKDLIDNKPKKPQAPASRPASELADLGPDSVKDLSQADAEALVKELGATEIQDINEPVKPKPWEKPKPKPKPTGGTVVDVDFF